MIRTIVKCSLNVNYWVTSNHTTLKRFEHTLFNWFTIFLWHNTTFNFIKEFKAFSWFIWFKANPNITILTTTTRLFCVLTLSFSSSTNSFAEGNLWLTNISFNVKFTLHSVNQDIKVKLTHSRHNCLTSFFICVNSESWVFFGKSLKSNSHFFLVGFSFWLNRNRNWRFGKLNTFKNYTVVQITKSCASCNILQTNNSGDVTSGNF